MDLAQRLRLWADELQAIASEGLHWSGDDPYDTHRYHRVRRIAAEIFAEQDTRSPATVEQQFAGELARWSPYPTGDAAIINEAGEMLLIQRKDDQLWAMPGGAFEVGETPAEGACREAWEETGVAVVPVALIGVYDSRYVGSRTIQHLYQFTFLCRPRDPGIHPTVSNETLDARWYSKADLPPLSPGHAPRIVDAFRYWHGETATTVFDRQADPETGEGIL